MNLKKLLFLFTMCLTLTLCACSTDTNSKSLDNENTTNATEKLTTSEPTTEEITEKQPTWSAATPGSKDFNIKGSDIEIKLSKDFDPYDKSLEITDDETKEKIYNMVRNIDECEPIDYSDFGKENIPKGGCYRRVYVKTANESYTVFVSNTDNIYSNIGVYKNGDERTRNFLVDEEYAAKFSKLCGIEQPMIKIN